MSVKDWLSRKLWDKFTPVGSQFKGKEVEEPLNVYSTKAKSAAKKLPASSAGSEAPEWVKQALNYS